MRRTTASRATPAAAAPPAPAGPRTLRRAALPAGVAAAVVVAVALRLWRFEQGLPDFLDEALPFKKAVDMWGWQQGRPELNPHFFNYPTLTLYLHLLLQKLHYAAGLLAGLWRNPHEWVLLYDLDPTGAVLVARAWAVLADVATVLAAWRIGERLRPGAGAPAALLLACSPALLLVGRAIHADTTMVALLAWSVERMLAWRATGGRGALAAAVVLAGLATGAKYPAAALVVPLAWTLAARDGRRGLRRWPLLAAATLGVFLLTSPYVVLDFPAFRAALQDESRHMASGHLGVHDRTGALYYARGLVGQLGWCGVLALLAAPFALLRRGAPGRDAAALAGVALLPFAAMLALVRMEADRYLLPVLPLGAPLAAAAALALADRLRAGAGGRTRLVTALALAALLAQPVAAGVLAAGAGRDDTRQQARRWCEANLRGDVLLQEAYGAALHTEFDRERIRRSPSFAAAGERVQARVLARAAWRAVTLPLVVSGRIAVRFEEEQGSVSLEAFAQASDFNEAFYDPALLAGVDYLLVSGAVRNRFAADPARYPIQNAFYAWVAARAPVAARFLPGRGVTGPEITIHRLDEAFQERLRREVGPLDIYWWTRPVPQAYREEAERRLIAPDQRSGGQVRRPSGTTAGWILTLRAPYDVHVAPFALQLAECLRQRGRWAPALRHAASVLAAAPDQEAAALLYAECSERLGEPDRAARMLENTLGNLRKDGRDSPRMRLELDRLRALSAAPDRPPAGP